MEIANALTNQNSAPIFAAEEAELFQLYASREYAHKN
jgi:hypothetical protein